MKEFFSFLISRPFLKHVILIVLFIIAVLLAIFFWLRSYTNHGQQIPLPTYIGSHISKAEQQAKRASFQLVVTDSVHVVGTSGGIILDQNPKPDALVKEKRKIYVRTSKYKADTYKLGELPSLYGNDYDQKATDLKRFEINTKIVGRQYDPGEPGHILEVLYNGKKVISKDITLKNTEIAKGGTLEFVVSDRAGGYIEIPNLVCQDYAAAIFYLKAGSKLAIGNIQEEGVIENRNTAYVVRQSPQAGVEIEMGSPINITIAQERPETCP